MVVTNVKVVPTSSIAWPTGNTRVGPSSPALTLVDAFFPQNPVDEHTANLQEGQGTCEEGRDATR
jgi:hypothetical protein